MANLGPEQVSCPTCGLLNLASANYCSGCGGVISPGAGEFPRAGAGVPAQAPNYLVQAILVTIFCCLPFGIVSIVFAAQVNGKVEAGDYAGAIATSNKAKTWAWVSFGVGLAISLIYVAIFVASFAFSFAG